MRVDLAAQVLSESVANGLRQEQDENNWKKQQILLRRWTDSLTVLMYRHFQEEINILKTNQYPYRSSTDERLTVK